MTDADRIKELEAKINYLRNPFDPDCATQEFWKKELPHVFKAWLAERHKVNDLESKLCKALEALRLARCRNDNDCANPKCCVERMREGIDKAINELGEAR